MDMLGGLMGAMAQAAAANGMNMDNIPDDPNIIDTTSEEIKDVESTEVAEIKEEDIKSLTIRTVTPFIINTNEKDGKTIATLTYLCVLANDSVITISINHIIEDDIDKEIIESTDFHSKMEFINNKICYNFIAKYLPAYYSELKFTANGLDINTEKQNLVTISCTNIKDKSDVKIFRMSADIYAAMNFVKDYIFNAEIENEHDLTLATVAGSKENTDVEFFVVENIENIVNMVSTKKKPTGMDAIKEIFNKEEDTNIGVVFRVSRTLPDRKEIVSILTPFDCGIVLDKSKFKGDTVEDLEKNYFGNADQYVATLTVDDTHLEGIDKTYMTIRGKTKNGTIRVFLLDDAIKNDLIHKIKEY